MMKRALRAPLAVLLAIAALLPIATPTALAQQPVIQPPKNTETPVRAFILELPEYTPSHYKIIALYQGHIVPALTIPYPLKPFQATKIKEILVDGKPLQELLRKNPQEARRLLFEDKNVKIITTPVEGLAWEPNSRKLLVIVPAGDIAARGKTLSSEEATSIELNTLALYRFNDYEIRLIKPTKPLAWVTAPPLTPILMNDTVFGYSITIGNTRLDIDITPRRIERLASTAPRLKPITQITVNAAPKATGTANALDNSIWLIPYTEPFTTPNGIPKSIIAVDMPSTAARASYANCWTYHPLPFTTTASASATIETLAEARVSLTVAIYLPGLPWSPIAEKTFTTRLKPNQSLTLTALWNIPAPQQPNPPKLQVCVYATAEWITGTTRHANLYIAIGGYKEVTLRSPVQPSPLDNTYNVKHQYAIENDPDGALIATITKPTAVPIAVTPNIAPGPLTFTTYIEGGSADFYLGNTHLAHLGSVQPNEFYFKSLDPETTLTTLSPYVITGRAIPLIIQPHGKVKWYAGYTTVSYVAFAVGIQTDTGGAKVYRPAQASDGLIAGEPLVLQILLADDGTCIEAGEAAIYVLANRPTTRYYQQYSFTIDVAASMKQYSYGIGKITLTAVQTEKGSPVDIYLAESYVSGDDVDNKLSEYLIWILGAAGIAVGGLEEAGAMTGAKALSYVLSIASAALGEPHIFAKLTKKENSITINKLGEDSVIVEGEVDSGWEPWSSWHTILYQAYYVLGTRGSEHPVQMSITAGVYIKLDWSYAWREALCTGMGYFEFNPLQ